MDRDSKHSRPSRRMYCGCEPSASIASRRKEKRGRRATTAPRGARENGSSGALVDIGNAHVEIGSTPARIDGAPIQISSRSTEIDSAAPQGSILSILHHDHTPLKRILEERKTNECIG